MNYDSFLPDADNQTRDHLWEAYNQVRAYFSQPPIRYSLQLAEANTSCGATFRCLRNQTRVIDIPATMDASGVLFHEITHDLFHSSVFHGNHNPINRTKITYRCGLNISNEDWGEGFCEAVRWLMGRNRSDDNLWLGNFQTRLRDNHEDIGIRCGERILIKSCYTLDGFASSWEQLTNKYEGSCQNGLSGFLMAQLGCPRCS